ncbi:MAG: recombinase family protein [Fusicatenibacter saccharivorans]|nr:recombinase family protein [Fusicatenibacter saccharivorans]
MKDAQENSFQSQQEYFMEYIQRHPGWVFAGMYADDGISGLSIRKRDGFNRMVADALDGKIDLIEMIPKLLKSLYEDKLNGKTSEENYSILSSEYADEREQLKKKILKLRKKMAEMGEKESER